MTERDLAIRVEHLSKRFRIPLDRSATLKHRVTHWRSASRHRVLEALRDLSFEVPAGQFLGVIGHNGSGKSTLLKILSRIYQPDSGRVSIRGNVSPFLELGVGFNPELTARENVFLSGAVLGLGRAELRRRLDDIIGFAELEQFVDHKLKNFSSGMEVRLAFALAIQAHAEILMMDEVLAVGDAAFQQKCFDTFNRYKREGRTIVLVTHELGAVNLYCDRALLLDHGRLVGDGRAEDVTAQYRRAVGIATESADQVERWGSGDVVVTAVRMVDERGVEDHNPMTGGFVRLELDYRIQNDAVSDFTCFFGIRRGDGLFVTEVSLPVSQYAEFGESQRGAEGTVHYEIPRLGLLGDSYRLNAELRHRHGGPEAAYDHLENAIRFRVIDRLERPGVYEPGGAWAVTPVREPAVKAPDQVISSTQT
ncbi:MAG TPA: ABC transporter ATP-binding protein [Candidatus Binatia bacterium]|nr:ABC transporter ATP-binding protein [Candidatus Binatia bacterium]